MEQVVSKKQEYAKLNDMASDKLKTFSPAEMKKKREASMEYASIIDPKTISLQDIFVSPRDNCVALASHS